MIAPTLKQIASGLRFPEGPVAMDDGSVILVEIERQTLSRVTPDGKIQVIARLGGGPNGAAMGPGGKFYVTLRAFRDAFPDLWDSILDCLELQRVG